VRVQKDLPRIGVAVGGWGFGSGVISGRMLSIGTEVYAVISGLRVRVQSLEFGA
jgi:hypothetical protein